MKQFAVFVMLFFGASAFCQETGKDNPLFSEKYEWNGISISAPDGYSAKKVKVAWKVNKEYSHKYGSIFDVAATSKDNQCIILYPLIQPRLITRGVDDCIEGEMGRINREVLQSKNVIDENGKHKGNDTKDFWPGKFLTYISGEAIRNSFGADEMCLYSIATTDSKFNEQESKSLSFTPENYPYLIRVFLLKEGGANYDVLLLLSKEAEQVKEKYIKNLFGSIVFDAKKIQETWEIIEPAEKAE